ncbi:uncharacterized protein LOC131942490 [Physella acuta]|uniref:uncharacterized protein LOC131942490 n=1 Tax=Physella acuta TaxID=109671 RepID=UPI0027DCEF1A|nr:uncharacterized protein LOC131942490 [Physella acuta]
MHLHGHKSLIGLGSVIEVQTGLVLDVHVTSLHCQTCATTGEKMKVNKAEYEVWLAHHKENGCTVNYSGTSGMMESEQAVTMWNRSLSKHNFRYLTMVGDGDSKAFEQVKALNVYGKDLVEKEECLNHVSKRLGTALRNVVQDSSKKKITLGGRKPGSLTAEKIRKLSIYYGRAI